MRRIRWLRLYHGRCGPGTVGCCKAVTHGNELVLAGKNDQGERAPQLADGVDDGLLNGIGVQGLVGNEEEMTSVSLVAAKSQP